MAFPEDKGDKEKVEASLRKFSQEMDFAATYGGPKRGSTLLRSYPDKEAEFADWLETTFTSSHHERLHKERRERTIKLILQHEMEPIFYDQKEGDE